MKIRIIYRSDGSVAIAQPTPKPTKFKGSDEEWIEIFFTKVMNQPRVMTSEGPKSFEDLGYDYDDIDSSELPQSRENRSAWTGQKGKGISIDQVKVVKLRADKEAKVKIDKKTREIAIESLKAEGELPADYEETENK